MSNGTNLLVVVVATSSVASDVKAKFFIFCYINSSDLQSSDLRG